jgi:hypothetical protein
LAAKRPARHNRDAVLEELARQLTDAADCHVRENSGARGGPRENCSQDVTPPDAQVI